MGARSGRRENLDDYRGPTRSRKVEEEEDEKGERRSGRYDIGKRRKRRRKMRQKGERGSGRYDIGKERKRRRKGGKRKWQM